MAVLIEPPRGRSGSSGATRYPGLTAEERGLGPEFPLVTERGAGATPLAGVPASPRGPPNELGEPSVASHRQEFPGPRTPSRPPENDGLFDVPGLLERLWLARALEVYRPRSGSFVAEPPPAPSVPYRPTGPEGSTDRDPVELRSAADPSPRPDPSSRSGGSIGSDGATAPPGSRALPRTSWVCPYCYLANDPEAATCRGCRSGSLYL
jgi:hypothetical protein